MYPDLWQLMEGGQVGHHGPNAGDGVRMEQKFKYGKGHAQTLFLRKEGRNVQGSEVSPSLARLGVLQVKN